MLCKSACVPFIAFEPKLVSDILLSLEDLRLHCHELDCFFLLLARGIATLGVNTTLNLFDLALYILNELFCLHHRRQLGPNLARRLNVNVIFFRQLDTKGHLGQYEEALTVVSGIARDRE